MVGVTFSMENWGIFKSAAMVTGVCCWLQNSCNSLVVLETESEYRKNVVALFLSRIYQFKFLGPIIGGVNSHSFILTGSNLHPTNLSIQWISRKFHHAGKFKPESRRKKKEGAFGLWAKFQPYQGNALENNLLREALLQVNLPLEGDQQMSVLQAASVLGTNVCLSLEAGRRGFQECDIVICSLALLH